MNTKPVYKVLPSDDEEEEVVDPSIEIRATCKAMRCQQEVTDYENCIKRIEGDTTGEKNCSSWSFDMKTCIDTCAAETLFSKLK